MAIAQGYGIKKNEICTKYVNMFLEKREKLVISSTWSMIGVCLRKRYPASS